MSNIGTSVSIGKMGFKLNPAQERAVAARAAAKKKIGDLPFKASDAQRKAILAREMKKLEEPAPKSRKPADLSDQTDKDLQDLYRGLTEDYDDEDRKNDESVSNLLEDVIAEIEKRKKLPKTAPAPSPKIDAYTTPYVYKKGTKKQDPAPWLLASFVLLSRAIKYSKEHKPKPTHVDKIGMGLVEVPLSAISNGQYSKECWADDVMVDWDWEEKETDMWYPVRVQGARVGFAWIQDESEKVKKGVRFGGFEKIVRVTRDIDENGEETQKIHARTEFESGDDEVVDAYIEKRLKSAKPKK